MNVLFNKRTLNVDGSTENVFESPYLINKFRSNSDSKFQRCWQPLQCAENGLFGICHSYIMLAVI